VTDIKASYFLLLIVRDIVHPSNGILIKIQYFIH
jgi:hypothetical protein